MTDTAEYWNDLRRNYPYCGPNYFHIPGYNCGHRHLYEAKKIGDVNCNDCLRAIKEGYVHKLPEGKTLSKSEKKRLNAIKKQEKLYGRCSCGHLRELRVNSTTKVKFLGCSNYPKCKLTTNIVNNNLIK